MKQIAWKVYSESGWQHDSNGRLVTKHRDTVFFDSDIKADDVRRSLVDHDGYPSDIIVKKEK